MNEDRAAVFTEYIRSQASKYYPEFAAEPISVQLLETQTRSTATLYRFQVKSKTRARLVFVKVPLCAPRIQKKKAVYEKPLLYPAAEIWDRQRLQYTALAAIGEYFADINQTQFGVIRVLDYLPQYQALVTEEASDPQLRELLLKESRLHAPFRDGKLATAFCNAGEWLRLFHGMPKNEDVKVRNQHRESYVDAICRLTDYLARMVGDTSFFHELAAVLVKKSCEVLPEVLPLGLGHGDYAPRNILIGSNARVTILDTFAKWRTPVYEDIGYFLAELKLSFPQVISQGLVFSAEQLAAYERAFLKGYFGDERIPFPAIRLYEILALLDKWSVSNAKFYQRSSFIQTIGQLGLISVNQYFKRSLKTLLNETAKVKQAGRTLIAFTLMALPMIALNGLNALECVDYLC